MSDFKVLGAELPRVKPGIMQLLLDSGLIYLGEDNELHIREYKNIPVTPTKANKDIK